MNSRSKSRAILMSAVLALALFLWPTRVLAHCDGMDGPVVKAAQRALDRSDVTQVLIWVQHPDEAEVKEAFEKTLAVRQLTPQARELADRYFFETVVRIHRASEGEPYTGLKPAGRGLGPAIPAADKALETGSVEPLVQLISDAAQEGIRHRFSQALAAKQATGSDVEAGRAFVRAYVAFIHYAESLYRDATVQAAGHSAHSESARQGAARLAEP